MSFTTETHAKWILTGEHAVLRGAPAIVYPHPQLRMSLIYKEDLPGGYPLDLKGFFESALALTGKSQLGGEIRIENTIPIRSGLGASAALSVATARLFHHLGWITDVYDCAKALEGFYHGESSGVDIAGAMHDGPVYFHNGHCEELTPTWNPNIFLTDSGELSDTKSAIDSARLDPATDQKIKESVNLAMEALNSEDGLEKMIKAINLARDCFDDWGLITPTMQAKMDELMNAGALAVKPTGSGRGGYILGLKER